MPDCIRSVTPVPDEHSAVGEDGAAMGRGRSRRKVEQDATEDVGGQLLLSFALLEGLLPVGRSKLEDAVSRPARERTEAIADVAEGLDVVHASAREERDKARVRDGAVVTADEEPIAPPCQFAAPRDHARCKVR